MLFFYLIMVLIPENEEKDSDKKENSHKHLLSTGIIASLGVTYKSL